MGAVRCASGCFGPQARDIDGSPPALVVSANSAPSVLIAIQSVGSVIVESPWSQEVSTLVERPSQIETWIVDTRACEQKMGLDPWSSIAIGRLDEFGGPLHGTDPEALPARITGRPSVFLIHGNGYTFRDAVEVRAVLQATGGLPPETLFIVFDWPSERVLPDLILDLKLSSGRPDLRLRAMVLEAASGHHWLNPGQRLDQALPTCEALLNLRNCADLALARYIFGVYTGLRPALGQVGLLASDLKRLGPLSARVKQINLYPTIGFSDTTFPQALEVPGVAQRIARYTSWSDSSLPPAR